MNNSPQLLRRPLLVGAIAAFAVPFVAFGFELLLLIFMYAIKVDIPRIFVAALYLALAPAWLLEKFLGPGTAPINATGTLQLVFFSSVVWGVTTAAAAEIHLRYAQPKPGKASWKQALAAVVIACLFFLALLIRFDARGYVNGRVAKGNLSALKQGRAALAAYRKDNGKPPAMFQDLYRTHYLELMIVNIVHLPGLHESNAQILEGSKADDAAGWMYDKGTGNFFINCTHTDASGKRWADY